MNLEEQWRRAHADGAADLPELTSLVSLQEAHHAKMDRIEEILAQATKRAYGINDAQQRRFFLGLFEEIQEILDEQ